MKTIDLRSDTVTEPTAEMRQAMADAVVGDDVYGEDPTVNRLENEAAEMFGMEAGLFVTSGSQGNLIALLTHTPRGNEVIIGDKSHIFLYEQGGLASVGGIMPHALPVQTDGTLELKAIEHAIRDDDDHFPRTRLIALENTQGTVGGVPLPVDYTRKVADLAHRNNLILHIDGARIFNAVTSVGLSPQETIEGADSMTFCLSKGLGAPAGSILLGSRDFIKEARRNRKLLGGGMRQSGVLAAPGLIALHKMSQRLQDDHDNAAYLSDCLRQLDDIEVLSQYTNFVFFELSDKAGVGGVELIERLKEQGIIISSYHGRDTTFRLVLHHWITRERVNIFIEALKKQLK
jgi:threonine aldolase